MSETILRCEGLSKRFDSVDAVVDVGFSLEEGDFFALLGPSGCGKTTLLRIIAGFERPNRGSIVLHDRMITGPRLHVPPDKRSIGMVFQDYALFPHQAVRKNIAFGVKSRRGRAERVSELLDLVGLRGLGDRLPHELSGGQQQRVALARTLAAEPDLVLLDEPFSNLDPAMRIRVREEVRRILATVGTPSILVTHDQDEAMSMGSKVGVMLDGRLRQVGTPGEIYDRPADRDVAQFIGDANFLPGTADGALATCELGAIPLAASARGAVELMLRPENFIVRNGGDIPACVERVEYFGHDEVLTTRLPSGRQIRVRRMPGGGIAAGDEIHLAVTGTAVPYVLRKEGHREREELLD